MNDFPPQHRMITRVDSDRLVRAFVMDEQKNFYPMTFPISAIDGVMGIEFKKTSAIILRSGIKIPVALAYEALESKIYASDFRTNDCVLDLCSVTGKAAQEIIFPKLTDKFNVAADSLKICAFLRRPDSNEFSVFHFLEADIADMEAIKTSRSKCDQSVVIHFNSGASRPFGGRAILDMPHDDLIVLMSAAKAKETPLLDLCEVFAKNPKKYGVDLL